MIDQSVEPFKAARHPRAAIDTAIGRIVIEIYEKKAPCSAAAFLSYVDEGRYAEAQFVRVIRPGNDIIKPFIEGIQLVVAGGVEGHAGIVHESTQKTSLKHVDGAVSLARLQVGTGTPATIFICIGDQPEMDFGGRRTDDGEGFAVFGRVVEGLDIVRSIQRAPTHPVGPVERLNGQLLVTPVQVSGCARIGGVLK